VGQLYTKAPLTITSFARHKLLFSVW